MSALNRDAVLEALAQVEDPAFHKPMLELGTLLDVVVEAASVRASVRLSAPSDELQMTIRERIHAALKPLGVDQVILEWDLQVPTRDVGQEDPIPQVRNVLLVMSGKGGVGKSTTAVNLALSLKRSGARVGLLDADIYGPSIPTMLGIQGFPSSEDGKTIEPLERFGVKLMSIGFLMEDTKAAIVWRGPMLHGALQQFLQDVRWGELDYLVVDLPPGTGDVALSLAQKMKVTGAIIVTTPQEVALQDVYKGVSMCEKLNISVLGVVENMSFFIDSAGVKHHLFGEGGGKRVAEFAKAPLLGEIPLEPKVREWGDNGTPVVQALPQSESAQAFARIADRVTEIIARRHFERHGGAKAPSTSGPRRLKIVR
ncbi:MAG TPA: Mrp/NBP35 family ATP-binding protein [Polyangiales bacterium]